MNVIKSTHICCPLGLQVSRTGLVRHTKPIWTCLGVEWVGLCMPCGERCPLDAAVFHLLPEGKWRSQMESTIQGQVVVDGGCLSDERILWWCLTEREFPPINSIITPHFTIKIHAYLGSANLRALYVHTWFLLKVQYGAYLLTEWLPSVHGIGCLWVVPQWGNYELTV